MKNRNETGRVPVAVVLSVLGVAAIVVAVMFLFGSGGGEVGISGDTDGGAGEEDSLLLGDVAAGSSGEGTAAVAAEIGESGAEREALAPGKILVTGLVVDKETGEGIPLFSMTFSRWDDSGANPWKEFLREEIADEEGRFAFQLDRGGKVRVSVQSASHGSLSDDIDLPEAGSLDELRYELDPGITANGLVVDALTGAPIAGAVVAHTDMHLIDALVRLSLGHTSAIAHAVSGVDGAFRLTALPEKVGSIGLDGKWRLAASHPDYAEGVVRCEPGAGKRVVIRLEGGARLFGTVSDDEGKPVFGAVVTLSSKAIPLPRSVFTDSEGKFRTPPVRPGMVYASAGPPPGEEERFPGLTLERKHVRVENADVEVHFGPSSQHVTWRGTVRNRVGDPIPGVALELKPAGADVESTWLNRLGCVADCDDEGRFEIGRLHAIAYEVHVNLSSWAHDVSIGKVVFADPGLVVRDITIAGAEIHGIVMDGLTGETLKRGGYVSTFLWEDMMHRSFSCPVDDEGRFSILGLPAGTYDVRANSSRYPAAWVKGLTVAKDEIVRDLKLVISSGGTMNIRVEGFAESGVREFRWYYGLKGEARYTHGAQYLDEEGRWEVSWERVPGTYVTTLEFPGIGTAVREFEIEAKQTTTIVIRPEDVAEGEPRVTVQGTVTRQDGSPAEGIRLSFNCLDGRGRGVSSLEKTATTDGRGAYAIPGFWAGGWKVRALFGGGAQVEFPQLHIAPDSPATMILDLTVASATITGVLRDSRTGQLLEKDGPRWWIFMRDAATNETVCQIQGGQTGPRFTFAAVPAGTFTMIVRARGYDERRAGPFTVGHGRALDVGEILLQPCGVLTARIESLAGEPITEFTMTCNEGTVYPWEMSTIEPGLYKCHKLSTGSIRLVVTAAGYAPAEQSLSLEPGVPQKIRFVLTAE